jgi:hypothetical protein
VRWPVKSGVGVRISIVGLWIRILVSIYEPINNKIK